MFADYFFRSSTAGSQILANFDETAFKETLVKTHVALAWDGEAYEAAEGRAALDLLVRLMARLYPGLALLPLDEQGAVALEPLRELAKAINPKISIPQSKRALSTVLVVGCTRFSTKATGVLYLGSDGWIAKLSRTSPVGSGKSANPFGAGVAACLAAGNVFRTTFGDQLGNAEPDDALEVSCLDLNLRSDTRPNPRFARVDVGVVHLVGIGAIGNGIVWALRNADVRGTFHVIDKERVDLGNLQRYVLALRSDEGTTKVDLASRELKGRGRRVELHHKAWSAYLDGLEDWRIDQVLVALDSAEDRMAIQASLPKWIANGWTRGGEAGVSVHHSFGGELACLACLYMPGGQAPHEDKIISDAIGIDVMDVRRRLDVGVALDEEFLSRVGLAKNVSIDKLRPFIGGSLRDFYSRGICGGQLLEFTMGDQRVIGEVPMAFQSALAGVMVAARLVAKCMGAVPGPNLTQVDLLRRFPDVPTQWRRRTPESRCICQDADYLARYLQKYPTA